MLKILYDTSLANNEGNSGIPQDTRLLLKTLALTPGIEPALPVHPRFFNFDIIKAFKDHEETLARAAPRVLDRYSLANTSGQWSELFASLGRQPQIEV